MVAHVNSNFLQTILWERFVVLASKDNEVPVVITKEVIQVDASQAKKRMGTDRPQEW